MNPKALIAECAANGVSLHLVGGVLKMRGAPDAVSAARDRLRPHKAQLIEYLATTGPIDLVAEFMEVDGASLTEAQALASIAMQPRASTEWLALIVELDAAIERYCLARALSPAARASIMAVRSHQSLASIPETLAWFKTELMEAG